jgi:CRISPR-associated protein Cst1
LQVVGFLKVMMLQRYRQTWFDVVNQAWIKPSKKLKPEEKTKFKPHRNWLYDDLFNLPEQATNFIRKYFLGSATRYVKQGSQAVESDDKTYLASWPIISIFLRRIINMEEERIVKIRQLADRLAQYVVGEGSKGKRFFNSFLNTDYTPFRINLIRVLNHEAKNGNLLFSLDDYIGIFEIAENEAYQSWKLSRDLMYIRMVEKLHDMKWAGFRSTDVLTEENEEIETT